MRNLKKLKEHKGMTGKQKNPDKLINNLKLNDFQMEILRYNVLTLRICGVGRR